MSRTSALRLARGFSLIELMIAITLGLILTAAVGTIFVQSKKSYALQEKLSRMQENGRFAMHFLIKDLRMAGYSGCVDDLIDGQTFNNQLNDKTAFPFRANIAMDGIEQGGTTWYPSADTTLPPGWINTTDAISVRRADPGNISLSDDMPNVSAELKVNSIAGLKENDIVMLSDCSSADVFALTAVQTADHVQHNAPAGGLNAGKELSKRYGKDAKLMKFIGRRYYIRNDDSGVPTLYRDTNGGSPEPLVAGIEQLQIRYGKDKTGDRYPDIYLPAGHAELKTETDWSSVVSMRIGIIARSIDQDVDKNDETYDVNGELFTAPGDRYRRRVYTTTILVRNLAR